MRHSCPTMPGCETMLRGVPRGEQHAADVADAGEGDLARRRPHLRDGDRGAAGRPERRMRGIDDVGGRAGRVLPEDAHGLVRGPGGVGPVAQAVGHEHRPPVAVRRPRPRRRRRRPRPAWPRDTPATASVAVAPVGRGAEPGDHGGAGARRREDLAAVRDPPHGAQAVSAGAARGVAVAQRHLDVGHARARDRSRRSRSRRRAARPGAAPAARRRRRAGPGWWPARSPPARRCRPRSRRRPARSASATAARRAVPTSDGVPDGQGQAVRYRAASASHFQRVIDDPRAFAGPRSIANR